MIKVGIVGASSFLGQSFLNFVRSTGYDLDLTLYAKEDIEHEGMTYHYFCYPDEMFDLEELLQYDCILYLAGSGIQATERVNEDLCYQLNFILPVTISCYLNEHNYRGRLITFGSYFEIGQNDVERRFSEDDLLRSRNRVPNVYSDSKRLFSQFLRYQRSAVNIHLVLSTIYGPAENPQRLVPYIINSLRQAQAVKLTGGAQTRQYLFIDDLSALLLEVIRKPIQGDIYNVGSPEVYTIREIVSKIQECTGLEGDIEFGKIDRVDTQMKYLALDYSKIEKLTGWNPETRLENAINKY